MLTTLGKLVILAAALLLTLLFLSVASHAAEPNCEFIKWNTQAFDACNGATPVAPAPQALVKLSDDSYVTEAESDDAILKGYAPYERWLKKQKEKK